MSRNICTTFLSNTTFKKKYTKINLNTHKHNIIPIFGENIKGNFVFGKSIPNVSRLQIKCVHEMVTNYSN